MQTWLRGQVLDDLRISDWVVTEFASALSLKVRSGQLLADQRRMVADLFKRTIIDAVTVLPVTRVHFQMAARLLEQSALGLRSGDALHLAVAAEEGATVCTRDRTLVGAAVALGQRAELV